MCRYHCAEHRYHWIERRYHCIEHQYWRAERRCRRFERGTVSVRVFHDVWQYFMSVSWCFTDVSECFKSVSWCFMSVSRCFTMFIKLCNNQHRRLQYLQSPYWWPHDCQLPQWSAITPQKWSNAKLRPEWRLESHLEEIPISDGFITWLCICIVIQTPHIYLSKLCTIKGRKHLRGDWAWLLNDRFSTTTERLIKGTVPADFFLLLYIFRITIVQNKIITIICSCLFFVWLIFIGLV